MKEVINYDTGRKTRFSYKRTVKRKYSKTTLK